MPMDTTSRVSEYQQSSSHATDAISCADSAHSVGNTDKPEQMQTGQLDGGEEDRIEIDETSSQQQDARPSSPSPVVNEAHDSGTFSARCDDVHLASPCLSSSSPEPGFDGNYRSETAVIQRTSSMAESRQASSRQTNESDSVLNADHFDFSIDVNEARETTHDDSVHGQSPSSDGTLQSETFIRDNENETGLRHQKDQQGLYLRHRRRRSASVKSERSIRNESSSCSSSSDSDESSSSEESYCTRALRKQGPDMEGGDSKKPRDGLKRKLDESCVSNFVENSTENSPLSSCDWYSSPKMACIVHGSAPTESTNFQHQQHQNLNGLISVLQSAALSSDEPAKISNSQHEEDSELALAVRIYENEAGDGSMPLTRSLSCPGLMELACES